MGQALLADALSKSGECSAEVRSAGLAALVGHPADSKAQRLMHERGLDISTHRARQLDRDLLHWAELVLVMDTAQKASVESWDPSARGKVFKLGEWSDFDIPDPYLQPVEIFESALRLILKGVTEWVAKFRDGAGK